MLVLSRQRDESIIVGDENTRFVQLSPLEIQKLKQCTDPGLLDLAERLLDERSVGRVEIACVDIRGDKVRLGVSAPKLLDVHRKEVWDAIRRENREKAEREKAGKLVDVEP